MLPNGQMVCKGDRLAVARYYMIKRMRFCYGCLNTKTKTLENEDLRHKTWYENEDPVKQKTVENTSSTHIKVARLSDIIGHYTSCVLSLYFFTFRLYLFYTASTTDPSYLLCFAMRANLVVKFLRVSSGKLTTHIILVQQVEFEC